MTTAIAPKILEGEILPREFGGAGGVSGGREIDEHNPFEVAILRCLGDRVRADKDTAVALWCALSNITWRRANGDEATCSFRLAGDIVAALRRGCGDRNGDYCDWYCSGVEGVVRPDIKAAMAGEGWTPWPVE